MEVMVNNVVNQMAKVLNAEQLIVLRNVLQNELATKVAQDLKTNMELLREFITSKSYENCSRGTLKLYESENVKFINWIDKTVDKVTKKDIEAYLMAYKNANGISNVTLNNMRRYISAFFTYLEYEDIITCNPVRKTKPVKEIKVVKKPFTELELEELRDGVGNLRDKAIIDTLNTTGMRVSELCSLDIEDIHGRSAVIRGKGNKERTVYFSERAWHNVQKYLNTRTDNNPALFVGLKRSNGAFNRITINAVESMIRMIGMKKDIVAHPHKFRRTVASRAANKGMPIQEIQVLLGHSKIDTTMIYCNVNESNIRLSHEKFVG